MMDVDTEKGGLTLNKDFLLTLAQNQKGHPWHMKYATQEVTVAQTFGYSVGILFSD